MGGNQFWKKAKFISKIYSFMAMPFKEKLTENWIKLKSFIKESIRILKITKKPSREEFKVIVKISGLGILLIGFIGFIITVLWTLLVGI